MLTLSPVTTHNSLAVSPSGTSIAEGSSVMASSPKPRRRHSQPHQSCPTCVTLPQDCHLTHNSELDPSLVSVLPVESDTGVEAAIFHSHMVDDQRAIRLQLMSRDKAQSGSSIPGGSSFPQ